MTAELSHRGFLLAPTADAVVQACIVREQLHDVTIPSLTPQRRVLEEAVRRYLSKDSLLAEPFLHDLHILIDFMRTEVEKGVQTTWSADEHDVHGGHHQRRFDKRTHSLAVAIAHLIELSEVAAEVIDFAEAGRLIDKLLQR